MPQNCFRVGDHPTGTRDLTFNPLDEYVGLFSPMERTSMMRKWVVTDGDFGPCYMVYGRRTPEDNSYRDPQYDDH